MSVVGDSEDTYFKSKLSLTNALKDTQAIPIVKQPEPPQLFKNSQRASLTALSALAMWGVTPLFKNKKVEKPLQKCGLKECNIMTVKDFCCAEHFKMAKAKHKA